MGETPCTFCGRPGHLSLPGEGRCCNGCAAQLGQLLSDGDARALRLWPDALDEEEGPGPEPTVRLEDGSRVELRARTAQLKGELSWEERARLCALYLDMGLPGEAVKEAAAVLAAAPGAPLSEAALALLFAPPLGPPDTAALRALLLPH